MWKCNRCGASTPKTCTCPKAGDATPPATPQQPVGLVCPFCRDDDFDAVGLKLHLTTYCEAYASVEVGNRVY